MVLRNPSEAAHVRVHRGLGLARRNLAKHGISFEDAKTVSDDDLYLVFADPDHSVEEHRFIIMGESKRGHLVVVAYTEERDAIRIVSARKATRTERKFYEEGF